MASWKIERVTTEPAENRRRRMSIHFCVEGETCIRNVRSHDPLRHVWRELLPAALRSAGYSPHLADGARWTRYAGCWCPCRPGFQIDDRLGERVYVTVSQTNADSESALNTAHYILTGVAR